MSIRQYIGARYVTKIYENTIDPASAEWQASINYEPLTLVTYNNGSYLSKKDVPASVGNPADNPTYWVQTGFYNGQIAQLQNDVNALDTTVNALLQYNQSIPTKVLCIGDSYGSLTTVPWPDKLQFQMGLDNAHFTNTCYNGAGFVGNAVGHTFLDQAQSIADPETYTHVLIMGGFNDANADASGTFVFTETAFYNCMQYIKTNFVNAQIFVGFMGYCSNKGTSIATQDLFISHCKDCAIQYESFCSKWGFNFISKLKYVLSVDELFSDDVYYGEVFHPNNDGCERLANVIYNAIHGIDLDINYAIDAQFNVNTTLLPDDNVNLSVQCRVNNGTMSITHTLAGQYISGGTSGTTLTDTVMKSGIKIATLSGGIVFENGRNYMTTTYAYRVGVDVYDATGILYMVGKDLMLRSPKSFTGYINSLAVEMPIIIKSY